MVPLSDAERKSGAARAALLEARSDLPVLRQWQRRLAAWYAQLITKPPIEDVMEMAWVLTGQRIAKAKVQRTLKRTDWKALVVEFRTSEAKRMKEIVHSKLELYLEAHEKGLAMALEARDYKSIPSYTIPMLDRMSPKKEAQTEHQPTVVINLQGGAAKAITAPIEVHEPTVTVERVPEADYEYVDKERTP